MRPRTASSRPFDLLGKQALIGRILQDFQRRRASADQHLPREVRSVLVHVHEHLFSPDLNVASVRRACQLGNNNVSTRFRCLVGVGLREYIETRRMAAAKCLLRQEDLEIYLIAVSVGYEHQETFCRAFRRNVGCTPSEWRCGSRLTSARLPSQQSIPFPDVRWVHGPREMSE